MAQNMVGLIFLFQGILFQRFLAMPPGNRITLKAATMPSPSNLASSPLTDTTIWTRDGLRIHTHAPLLAAIRSGAIVRQYTRCFLTYPPPHFPYQMKNICQDNKKLFWIEILLAKKLLLASTCLFFSFWNWKLGETLKKRRLCVKSTCVYTWLSTIYWLQLIIVSPQPYTEEPSHESWKSLWTRGGVHTASSRLQ